VKQKLSECLWPTTTAELLPAFYKTYTNKNDHSKLKYIHNFRRGGVCIFMKKNVQFLKINNMANCKEKDLELCAIQLTSINMCIVCVYRAPSGDFFYF
jgi:hypothetical protein